MNKFLNKRFHSRKQLAPQLLTMEVLITKKWGKKKCPLIAQSVDISSGGVGIFTYHSFQDGDVVKIGYPIKCDRVTLPIYSVVVWCSKGKESFRVGLRFLG